MIQPAQGTIGALLDALAPTARIVGVDGSSVGGQQLAASAAGVTGSLCRLGVPLGGTVAIGMRPGVPGALGLLGTARAHTAVPLPRDAPVSRLVEDLVATQAGAVVADVGPSNLLEAAGRLDLPVLELPTELLHWPDGAVPVTATLGADPVLVLHSSGSTGRPRTVTVSHRNLFSSATSVIEALELTAEDRSLAVMPLFHVHGIAVSLLAALLSGGCVICTPSPTGDPATWIREQRPTWWSAVPAVHQAILRATAAGSWTDAGIRVIRSGSAALPAPVRTRLAETFGACVLESYGLTETAGPVASERLVGGAVHRGMRVMRQVEVAVLVDGEPTSAPEAVGEIALRGPAVTGETADGWLHTGDLGTVGPGQTITILDRLHDRIMRGGEDISPVTIESALLKHPDVEAAAACGVPHPTLEQVVAAAVVTREGAELSAGELIAFAAQTLTPVQLPREISFVDALPLGPTGKVDRGQLSRALASSQQSARAAVFDSVTEASIAGLMAKALGHGAFGADDDFYAVGGDSLSAAGLFADIETVFGLALTLGTLASPQLSMRQLAATITTLREQRRPDGPACPTERALLVPVQSQGSLAPLFMVFSIEASLLSLRGVPTQLEPEQPVIGLLVPQVDGRFDPRVSVEELAAVLVGQLTAYHPAGPLHLSGHSFGGLVAHEMARQLLLMGRDVQLVILLDTRTGAAVTRLRRQRRQMLLHTHPRSVALGARRWATRKLDTRRNARRFNPRAATFDGRGAFRAAQRHREGRLGIPLHLIAARESTLASLGWTTTSGAGVHLHPVDGDHLSMLQEPHLHDVVQIMNSLLQDASHREHGR